MKKYSTFLFALLLSMAHLQSYAYDFQAQTAEGAMISYSLINNYTEVEVTYGDRDFTGDIHIPESVSYKGKTYNVTAIGQDAFSMNDLQSITIPNSVTLVGLGAFKSCHKLTSITFGNGVTEIGGWAFEFCEKLSSITLPEGLTYIGTHTFEECTSLTSIVIPDKVTYIGADAFSGCKNLTDVVIGNGVKQIKQGAFNKCSNLSNLTIGSSVEYIETWAFNMCKNLLTITCLPTVPPVCDGFAFLSANNWGCYVYVPVGTVDAYKEADVWKYFTHIQEIGSSSVTSVKATGQDGVSEYFTLQGVTTNSPKSGVYISNGKKILVK